MGTCETTGGIEASRLFKYGFDMPSHRGNAMLWWMLTEVSYDMKVHKPDPSKSMMKPCNKDIFKYSEGSAEGASLSTRSLNSAARVNCQELEFSFQQVRRDWCLSLQDPKS